MLKDGSWNWGKISMHLPTQFHQCIAAVTCSIEDGVLDRMIRDLKNSGLFSPITAYKKNPCCRKWSQEEPKWKVVWSWKEPKKMKTFLWLVFHNTLMTNERWIKRKMTADGGCSRCNEGEETTEHVLRSCYRAADTWYRLLPKGKFTHFMNLDWDSWLMQNLTN